LDFSTNELVANLFGGLHVARPERLRILMELGLPVVVAPGALSLIVLSKEDAMDPKYDGRQKYYHNPRITLARTSREEMAQLGRHMASILNLAVGPVRFLYPTEGFASQDKQSYSLFSWRWWIPNVDSHRFKNIVKEDEKYVVKTSFELCRRARMA
jgi:uncharacterized protein (UPF0261 family)